MSFCCLLYHGVAEHRRWGYISPDALRRQLEWLLREGFVVESFGGLERRLGDSSLPARYVALSFDDGHRSQLAGAEILAELALSATFFVATAACRQDSRYLGESGLRRLAEVGELGSHTVSHRRLTSLAAETLRSELRDSKRWLEDVVGREIAFLSAPLGAIDRRVVDMALECGYRLVGASGPSANDLAGVRESRVVHRLAIDHATSLATFRRAVTADTVFFRWRRLRASLLKMPREMMHRGLPRKVEKRIVRLWSKLR